MVGGTHYKNMSVSPWDVVDTWPLEQRIGYYRGGALKYLMRVGSKDESVQEIGKGLHYMEKLLEVLKGLQDAVHDKREAGLQEAGCAGRQQTGSTSTPCGKCETEPRIRESGPWTQRGWDGRQPQKSFQQGWLGYPVEHQARASLQQPQFFPHVERDNEIGSI
jgi:hypothetical protein